MKMSSFSSAVDATLSGCPFNPAILIAGVYAGTEGFVYRSDFQHLSGSDASPGPSSVGKTPCKKLSHATRLARRMWR